MILFICFFFITSELIVLTEKNNLNSLTRVKIKERIRIKNACYRNVVINLYINIKNYYEKFDSDEISSEFILSQLDDYICFLFSFKSKYNKIAAKLLYSCHSDDFFGIFFNFIDEYFDLIKNAHSNILYNDEDAYLTLKNNSLIIEYQILRNRVKYEVFGFFDIEYNNIDTNLEKLIHIKMNLINVTCLFLEFCRKYQNQNQNQEHLIKFILNVMEFLMIS